MAVSHGFDNSHGVRGTIEEIRIAKRDVLSARRHLGVDVGQHDIRLDDAELTVVDRHDRTMAAEMTASAAGLRVPHGSPCPVGERQRRIARKWRQSRSIRYQELQSSNFFARGADLQVVPRVIPCPTSLKLP